jgi:hypothetical protein
MFNNKTIIMKQRIIRAVAGTLILTSVVLTIFVSIYWIALAAFVGLNLFQWSITNFCPMEYILTKLGVE